MHDADENFIPHPCLTHDCRRLNKKPQSELEKSFILKKDSGPSVDDRTSSGTSGSGPKAEGAPPSPAK